MPLLTRRTLLRSLAAAAGMGAVATIAPSAASGTDDAVHSPDAKAPPTGLAVGQASYVVPGLDAGSDNTAALNSAFASASPGDELIIPPGGWPHSATIELTTSGITVSGYGAFLVATVPRYAGLHITGSSVTVRGITHEVLGATQRGNGENLDDSPFSIDQASDVVLQDVVSIGARDSGIFVFGALRARLLNVQVRNSLADGIHLTYGSTSCIVDSPTVLSPGDDGVAVVSYTADPEICSDIRIDNSLVIDGYGRGIAVSGGDNITITKVTVRRSRGSGIYLASEQGQFDTAPVTHCRVSGGTVDDANWDPDLDTGNVGVFQLVSSSTSRDIVIEGLTVTGSEKAAAPYIKIGTSNGAGGRFDGLLLRDIVLPGGSVYLDGSSPTVAQVGSYSCASTTGGADNNNGTTVASGSAADGDGITLSRIRR